MTKTADQNTSITIGDHVIAEYASDLKKDMALESVVKRLHEASTTQVGSYGFCDIIAINALHNFAMCGLANKVEDFCIDLLSSHSDSSDHIP